MGLGGFLRISGVKMRFLKRKAAKVRQYYLSRQSSLVLKYYQTEKNQIS
jgi:hypothetical protein